MTLFIYEHLTSGALADEAFSAGLMHEGDAMLQALCHDLTAFGHALCVMRDARLPELAAPSGYIDVITVSSQADYQQTWQQSLQQYQHFVVIAPETGGILQQLVTMLEQHDKTHYGANSEAISQCSNKLACFKLLQQQHIATPDTFSAQDWLQKATDNDQNWVVKPLDGAGCEQTYRLNNREMKRYLSRLSQDQQSQMIIQPYISGNALSLSLFIEDEAPKLLSVNRQHIVESSHQLTLTHSEPCPEIQLDQHSVMTLARQIHATMPGLWGFVGIDMVQSADRLWLIEINPRLTSSYADPAFRRDRNPAALLHQYLKS